MWGVSLRELSELGSFAAKAINDGHVAFISWTGDGRMLSINPQFEKLTGYSRDELEKMRWPDDLAVPGTCDSIKMAMNDLDPGRGQSGHAGELLSRDGTQREVTILVRHYLPRDGEGPFYFSFINEHEKESMALQEAKAESKLLIDLMSHEIDNMNRVSINYLEMALGAARLSPGERKLIIAAMGSLVNVSRTIDNIRRVQDRDRLNPA
jgi:PAS domain S-box-containing protein